MSSSPTTLGDEFEPSRFSLTLRDQVCLLTTLLFAFTVLGGYWVYQGRSSNPLVEIDRTSRPEFEFKININTASVPELAMLPDVGATLATRIVTWRDEHGPFQSSKDLRKVRGIGPKTLENIRPLLLPLPLGD